jgi:hypothetical protein
MNPKYEQWINANVPRDVFGQAGQCTHFSPLMAKEFPELKIKTGVVWSHENTDNHGKVQKQYPHMWLEDPQGNIVDPTVGQFMLLGELVYEEAPEDTKVMNKCMNCGRYFYKKGYACSAACEKDLI